LLPCIFTETAPAHHSILSCLRLFEVFQLRQLLVSFEARLYFALQLTVSSAKTSADVLVEWQQEG
jgi:hypothetical protein